MRNRVRERNRLPRLLDASVKEAGTQASEFLARLPLLLPTPSQQIGAHCPALIRNRDTHAGAHSLCHLRNKCIL